MIFRRWIFTLSLGLFAGTPVWADAPMPLAIWPFDSYVSAGDRSNAETRLLEELLPELTSSELNGFGKVRLVERRQLSEVLKEQKLGASDLTDEANRLRLGRLIGARWMLFGSYLRIGSQWQIDLRIVDVESTQVLATGSASGMNDDYLGATRIAVAQIIRRLQ